MRTTSFAEDKAEVSAVSANIAIVNDYVWRGKTQSDDKKAIQGGFDWGVGNGFALGIWGSSLGTDGGSEFDYYGAYSGELDNGIGYEVGYIDYRYSKDNGAADFKEAYVGGSYGDFSLTYYRGRKEAANYVEGNYGTSITDVDFSLTLGKYSNTTDNTDGYKVYGLSLGKSYDGLDYALGFTKTKENSSTNENEKNTVFSVSKSF
ncbi:Conserved hypothetical protein 2001 [uncultured Candidatus Thioglobus sp.]|nr:Conserved hypothetical protein 2001 [uncultured Candidatus Thioglobus sp.]